MKAKRSIASTTFDALTMLLITASLLIVLYPLYYIAIISISDGRYVMQGAVTLFPRGINLGAYAVILKDPTIIRSYQNTVLYVVVGTAVNIVATTLCAYPLSRRTFSGRRPFTVVIIFTMFFHGGLIPTYLLVQSLGIVNTLWAIALPPAINTWYMMIMRTFFQGISEELLEAARIDGANDLVVLVMIVLPLSVPIVTTLLMFYGVWHWNSFFPALIYLNQRTKYPLQIILRNMLIAGDMSNQTNAIGLATDLQTIGLSVQYSAIMVAVLPIVWVYPFILKYFKHGMMVGSLKG